MRVGFSSPEAPTLPLDGTPRTRCQRMEVSDATSPPLLRQISEEKGAGLSALTGEIQSDECRGPEQPTAL